MARSRKMDWIVGWWSEAGLTSGGCPTNLPFVGFNELQQPMLQLVSDADLAEHGDDVVVERVVGQYLVFNNENQDAYPALLHMRLAVRPEDPTNAGAPVWNAPIDPFAMAEERFMWHKVHLLASGGGNLGADRDPEWSHLDVRVNRRVQELERLVLMLKAVRVEPVPAGTECDPVLFLSVAAWIRVLISVG